VKDDNGAAVAARAQLHLALVWVQLVLGQRCDTRDEGRQWYCRITHAALSLVTV
jgi:hypothetical protein